MAKDTAKTLTSSLQATDVKTITYDDVNAAASGTYTFDWVLPPNAIPLDCHIYKTAAFTNATGTTVIDVGTTTNVDSMIDNQNLVAAAGVVTQVTTAGTKSDLPTSTDNIIRITITVATAAPTAGSLHAYVVYGNTEAVAYSYPTVTVA